jgi:hypothetical protein
MGSKRPNEKEKRKKKQDKNKNKKQTGPTSISKA